MNIDAACIQIVVCSLSFSGG